MRILQLTSMYPSAEDPTAGIFIKTQIDSLVRAGVTCDVFPMTVAESRSPGVWRQVRRKLSSAAYDLVHCHYGYALLPMLVCRDVPFVVSFCGTDVMGGGRSVEKKIKHSLLVLITNMLSRRAIASIAKTDRLRSCLWFASTRATCEVIPNGVDFEVFRPLVQLEAREALGLDPSRRYVLFAGHHRKAVKRMDLIEEAVQVVRQSVTGIELLKVDGVSQACLNQYYAAADCLVLASAHEGSPNVVKEAMACNLPVVSVDVGDVRDVLGDTEGCRIVDRDPEALAEGIRGVVTAPRRTEGRVKVEHLRLERVAERVKAFYEGAMSSGGYYSGG